MQVITKIPTSYHSGDDSLFEFVPIKRIRKSITHHSSDSTSYSHIFFKALKNFNSNNGYSADQKNVVIKNIGNMNQKHLKNALSYVLKNSENKIAINESFELKTYKEILEDWKNDFSLNENTNEAMHLVFSLKEPHSKSIMELLKTSVFETMKSNFSEYQFVLIPHTHQNNPHIHCIVNKTNIWSGKKLRFAKKTDCRNFFFKLKEDFKNELYHFSGGRLDYKNDVRLKLDSIFQDLETINEKSKTLSHRGFYAESIKVLNAKYTKIKDSIKVLESQIIKLNESEADKVQKISIKISAHNEMLQNLKKEMEYLGDWDQNFTRFTKSFNLYEKKKALYNSIIKIKPYASKILFKHLSVLQNQLLDENICIQGGIKDIAEGFDKNIFLNKKTHIFALNKYLKQLRNYRVMLKEFKNDDFNANIEKINRKEREILELVEIRIARLLPIYKHLKLDVQTQNQNLNENLSDISKLSFQDISEILTLTSLHLRNLKTLNFLSKELLLAKKILKDTSNTSLKEFNQKTQNQIVEKRKQMQELNETLKQHAIKNNLRG